jgi:hypothetical protein
MIYAHVQNLEIWKSHIEEGAKSVFAEEFNVSLEQIELEIEFREGSLWAKIKPKLRTIVLILSLYNNVDNAAEKLPKQLDIVGDRVAKVVQQVTDGRNASVDGCWKRPGVLKDMLERFNPAHKQDRPPDEQ